MFIFIIIIIISFSFIIIIIPLLLQNVLLANKHLLGYYNSILRIVFRDILINYLNKPLQLTRFYCRITKRLSVSKNSLRCQDYDYLINRIALHGNGC